MDQNTALRWLKFGSALTIFFGVLVAAAATPIGAAPTQFLADLIFFPIDGAQDLAAKLIITSIVTWFVVDSTGSIVAGAPLNAAFNVLFLLIFCVPLWRYR